MILLYSDYTETVGLLSGGVTFATILSLAVMVLEIILFFKIWRMTNDVAKIKETIVRNSNITSLFFYLTGKQEDYKKMLDKELYQLLLASFKNVHDSYTDDQASLAFIQQKEDVFSKIKSKYEKVGAEIPEGFKSVTYDQLNAENELFKK
jgi:MFS superfamily sulfate permease-like transporter